MPAAAVSATLSPAVESLLGSMTLDQKVGQVFVFTFNNLTHALHDLRLHPGGFIRIYSDAMTAAKQHAELQARTELPLLIAADFERGVGCNVTGAADMVTLMTLGAAGDEDLARRAGRAIAEEAAALGVNMNYVPVLDVNVNDDNPIINTRSFGGDAALVARLGAAFIAGHREGGTLTCGKHFPGHGDTAVDSHSNLGAITVDRARLDAVELVPFRAAIAAGVDAIMSAHLLIPCVDPSGLPGTLSRPIMTDLLRGELGFTGVAVSDALEMGAIARNYGPAEAIVLAFNAGVDQLIMPLDNARAVKALRDAVADSRVTEERLDEAVGRILTMKEKQGLLARDGAGSGGGYTARTTDLTDLAARLDTAEHRATALDAALAGITLVHDDPAAPLLPLAPGHKVAVVTFSNQNDGRSHFLLPKTFGDHLAICLPDVTVCHCATLEEHHPHEFGARDRALAAAAKADVIVLGAHVAVVIAQGSIGLESKYLEFLAELAALGKPTVLVSFGSPYIGRQVPADAYVCAYGETEAAQQAAAMLLAGERPFRGTAPVSLARP